MPDHQICDACECVSHCRKNGCVPLTPMPEESSFAVPPSTDVKTLRRELALAYEGLARERGVRKEQGERIKEQATALILAEAALADIGDADREPGDDVAWCEARAAQALPAVRAALKKVPQ